MGSQEKKLKSREGIGDRKEDYMQENPRSGHNLQYLGEENNEIRRQNEDKNKGQNQKEEVERSMRRWRQSLDDEWYGNVIEYKLTGGIVGESRHGRGTRRAKLQSGRYVLKDNRGDEKSGVELLYREVSGELARYVTQENVPQTLYRYHDCHRHFARGIIAKLLRRRYYWPTHIKDFMWYSWDCDAYQRFGPIKPPLELKPILNLQPIDMIGMDFLGPTKLEGVGKNK